MDHYDHCINFSYDEVELRATIVDGFVVASDSNNVDTDVAAKMNVFLRNVEVEESDTGRPVEVTPAIRARILAVLKEDLGLIRFDSSEEAANHAYAG